MTPPSPYFAQRRAGVLLHPTSLPSGTLADFPQWLDFMACAQLRIWQMLPLGIPQHGLSPYQCLSAFAINPALLPPIKKATSRQLQSHDFLAFCDDQRYWLHDYALFVTLKRRFKAAAWFQWPLPFRNRDAAVLHQVATEEANLLQQLKWEQFTLHRQWQQLRREAQARQITLFGDMPIFVAHDSVDLWAHRDQFLTTPEGDLPYVTGVPPDYFSATGQRWGNPHYNWVAMRENRFEWWRQRIHHHLSWFDLVRIDHFRGLEAVWMIDAAATTAIEGYWQPVPGQELLEAIQADLGENLPLVAEDLGVITDGVRALKARFNLPGMSILQFSFDHFSDNPHKPANIGPQTVVYTGTHDNDTTLGWYQSLEEAMQHHVHHTLSITAEIDPVTALIQTALQTQAALAIIPMQDWLRLDSAARMNTPGTTEGNWLWRLHASALSPSLCQQIAAMVVAGQRA